MRDELVDDLFGRGVPGDPSSYPEEAWLHTQFRQLANQITNRCVDSGLRDAGVGHLIKARDSFVVCLRERGPR